MGTPNKLCLFENFERPQARGDEWDTRPFGAPRWEPNDRKRVRSRRVGHSIARACDRSFLRRFDRKRDESLILAGAPVGNQTTGRACDQSEGMRSNRRTPVLPSRCAREDQGKGEAFLSNGTCNVEHIFYNQNSLAIQTLRVRKRSFQNL